MRLLKPSRHHGTSHSRLLVQYCILSPIDRYSHLHATCRASALALILSIPRSGNSKASSNTTCLDNVGSASTSSSLWFLRFLYPEFNFHDPPPHNRRNDTITCDVYGEIDLQTAECLLRPAIVIPSAQGRTERTTSMTSRRSNCQGPSVSPTLVVAGPAKTHCCGMTPTWRARR